MIEATRTVYCYYFPEIRKIINSIVKKYPHNIFLSSIKPGLDNFHIPVIKKFIKYHKATVPYLKDFKHQYVTGGASEGIFHILSKLKTENPNLIIYTLKGEYEGYKEYAKGLGIHIQEVEYQTIPFLTSGIFFISNPSAIDGNIISNGIIKWICTYHRVIYDMTYAGLTEERKFDVSNKNILAVVSSLSKPFGIYYHRIGFTFSREPIETLEGNIWFKNIFSLIIADKIFDIIKPQQLYNKYRPLQEKFVEGLNLRDELGLRVSDVLLLANIRARESNNIGRLDKYERGEGYRLCLTPFFLEAEKLKKWFKKEK